MAKSKDSALPQKNPSAFSSWFGMLKQTAKEWSDDDAMTWAAAVACYTVLALAPLLVLAMKVLAIFLSGKSAHQQLLNQAKNWMGPAVGQAIQEIINKASQHTSHFATIVSIVLAVISAGGVFAELQQAMNRIWKVKPTGKAWWSFLYARLVSVAVLAAAVVIMLASVGTATWLEHLTTSLGTGWKYLTWIIDVIVSIGVLTVLFALLYRTVPDARIAWRTTWVGAFMSAILFEIGKFGLALYFKFAAPSSAFGAVGSLAAVLIWIYYSSLIVFFGAEFTQVYAKARGHGIKPSKFARALSECDETETATPSPERPGEKPIRPAKHSRGPQDRNGAEAPAGVAHAGHSGGWRRSSATGAIGFVLGIVLGAYGAAKGAVGRRAATSTGFSGEDCPRRQNLEQKLARADRIRRYIEAPDAMQRIEALERRLLRT